MKRWEFIRKENLTSSCIDALALRKLSPFDQPASQHAANNNTLDGINSCTTSDHCIVNLYTELGNLLGVGSDYKNGVL